MHDKDSWNVISKFDFGVERDGEIVSCVVMWWEIEWLIMTINYVGPIRDWLTHEW